ncbi:hypothetical protein T03_8292 [Trichinella britovi]|uniref:Uncharacterized protein n=1 Tax=Trichinella britovi TaxID=45882 RepID=A0A0V1CBS3_TRIBR|nr:hypothetical protein T03_8292 [Trichinella britovi]
MPHYKNKALRIAFNTLLYASSKFREGKLDKCQAMTNKTTAEKRVRVTTTTEESKDRYRSVIT